MLILDSLYSKFRQKTPSENVARQMLKEALLNEEHKGRAIIVTTFSSHIARLHSISEFGKRLNRKVVFLGRSLGKYISSAQNLDLINFGKIDKRRGTSKEYRKRGAGEIISGIYDKKQPQ